MKMILALIEVGEICLWVLFVYAVCITSFPQYAERADSKFLTRALHFALVDQYEIIPLKREKLWIVFIITFTMFSRCI